MFFTQQILFLISKLFVLIYHSDKLTVGFCVLFCISLIYMTPAYSGVSDNYKKWPTIIDGTDTKPPYIKKKKSSKKRDQLYERRARFMLLKNVQGWLEEGQEKYGITSAEYANRLLGYARLSLEKGDIVAAISGYKEALDIFTHFECNKVEMASESAHGLISVYFLQHEFTKAEKVAREAYAHVKKCNISNRLILRKSLQDLAMSLYYQSKYNEAIEVYNQLMELKDITRSDKDSDLLALAVLHYAASDITQANKLYGRCKVAHQMKLCDYAQNQIHLWKIKTDRSRVPELAWEKRWTFTDPDFQTAIRSADWIGLCQYRGYEKIGDISFNNPPNGKFWVDTVFKGTRNRQNKVILVKFKFKAQRDLSSWKFGEDKMPELGSKWIILLTNEFALPHDGYRLYKDHFGMIEASKENLHNIYAWYGLQHGQP